MKKVFALLPIVLLSGCSSWAGKSLLSDQGCSWVKPIYVVKGDRMTDHTATEIVAHNRKWKQFCGAAR